MNKNAYEIRLEVLEIAHRDLMHAYYEAINLETDPVAKQKLKLPTTEEIINRANLLYQFVNNVNS
jgi:uncharacterized membrane protein YgaE (UPF0421/DUF939 family)